MPKRYDFMRIRQAIIAQITQAGDQPLRFPSTRKLAEKFGVSQPTAFKAVKHLIADGYLSPCQSGGTISHNPGVLGGDVGRRIVGVVWGSGNNVYNNQYYAQLHSEIVCQYTHRSWRNHYQDIYLETAAELETVCRQNSLSGLILIGPTPGVAERARNLKSGGLPVVSFVSRLEGISSFYIDFGARTEFALRLLFQEKRTHVVFSSWPDRKRIETIRQVTEKLCSEFHVPGGHILLLEQSIEKNMERLKELLEFGMKFDGVVLDPMFPAHFELVKRHMDVEDQCRFIIDECGLFEDLNYSGYAIRYDLASAVNKLLDELEHQLTDPRTPVVQEAIAVSALHCRNGKIRAES